VVVLLLYELYRWDDVFREGAVSGPEPSERLQNWLQPMHFVGTLHTVPFFTRNGCPQPADVRQGGLLRLIRPLFLARVCTILLGLGLSVPGVVHGAPQTKSSAKKTTSGKSASARKASYSASSSASRKARLARARAAARAREQARLRLLQEAMTPRFKADPTGAMVPDIRAAAAIIFNPETGQILWEENAQDKRSIASITKVMTAIVFLEDNPDLAQVITIERGDVYAASTTFLRRNERITLGNLLHLTLIASDNAAARALARISHGGTAAFVERMNEKAIELGLENTTFADPSGLNPENMSSAYDLSRLISFASADERIAPIMRTADFKVSTSRRTFSINNTNRLLLGGDVDVVAGKTGFITKAGYCLATLLRLPQGNQVAVVVLGANSNTSRFWETRHLFNWLSAKAADVFSKDQ
jgi:D-alanyl-D-alanine endopeptidase (penicillin-binding protein 7)